MRKVHLFEDFKRVASGGIATVVVLWNGLMKVVGKATCLVKTNGDPTRYPMETYICTY